MPPNVVCCTKVPGTWDVLLAETRRLPEGTSSEGYTPSTFRRHRLRGYELVCGGLSLREQVPSDATQFMDQLCLSARAGNRQTDAFQVDTAIAIEGERGTDLRRNSLDQNR